MGIKQTAVDIFHDRVIEMLGRKRPLTTNEVAKVWAELKEMEKAQIAEAYQSDRFPCSDEDAEQYYKETYED